MRKIAENHGGWGVKENCGQEKSNEAKIQQKIQFHAFDVILIAFTNLDKNGCSSKHCGFITKYCDFETLLKIAASIVPMGINCNSPPKIAENLGKIAEIAEKNAENCGNCGKIADRKSPPALPHTCCDLTNAKIVTHWMGPILRGVLGFAILKELQFITCRKYFIRGFFFRYQGTFLKDFVDSGP